MAKRSAARKASTTTRTIVVRPMPSGPARPIVVRPVLAKVKKRPHRGGGGKARTEKHRVGAIVGAGVLGLLDKSGVNIPTLPFLGKAGTAGVALWAVGKYMGSPWADDGATGCLCIAAYELAKEGHISGDPDYVAGV